MSLLVATPDGAFRTPREPFADADRVLDAGHVSRLRRDTAFEFFHHRYAREAVVHDGTLYAGLAGSGPTWDDGAGAAAFASDDGGRTLRRVSYPGEPEAFVVSWTSGDALYAGTNEGAVLRASGDGWTELGRVPVSETARLAYGVTSLTVV